MTPHRRPAPKASPYITPEGYERLRLELDELWRTRAEVTRALAAAAAEGDRSENAEYIYRKKQQREIDRRIRYLQRRLPNLTVVREAPHDRDRVYFGAWVRVVDGEGREREYRIVGPDEAEPKKGWVSLDSPVARALLKKAVDEEVSVHAPDGPIVYEIVAIRYATAP